MPKNITGSRPADSSGRPSITLTASVPVTGDRSSAARFEAIIQGLLNNDATLQSLLTDSAQTTSPGRQLSGGAYLKSLLVGANRIGKEQILDDAIDASKLSAAIATGNADIRKYLQLGTQNALSWNTPLKVRTDETTLTASGVDDSGNTQTTGIGDKGTVTLKIKNAGVDNAQLKDGAVNAAKIEAGQIGETQISDGAVTHAKLAANAVEIDNIADDAVGVAELKATGTAANGKVLTATGADAMAWQERQATARGLLIATSSQITNGEVAGWTLGTLTSLGSIARRITAPAGTPVRGRSGVAALRFPHNRPAPNVNGLWIALLNSSNPKEEVDEIFLPWKWIISSEATLILQNVDEASQQMSVITEIQTSSIYAIGVRRTGSRSIHSSFSVRVYLSIV